MSGLDVENEAIIEVGAIITDMEFNRLDDYHAIIKQPQKFIDGMDEWNTKHHGASGLIDLIPNGKDQDVVEEELCELVRKHFPDSKNPPVIAGNTIQQDRNFINFHMKKFASMLHYRMLDVSSWKIIMLNKFNVPEYEKKGQHRAIDDIEESIGELKHYLKYISI